MRNKGRDSGGAPQGEEGLELPEAVRSQEASSPRASGGSWVLLTP